RQESRNETHSALEVARGCRFGCHEALAVETRPFVTEHEAGYVVRVLDGQRSGRVLWHVVVHESRHAIEMRHAGAVVERRVSPQRRKRPADAGAVGLMA